MKTLALCAEILAILAVSATCSFLFFIALEMSIESVVILFLFLVFVFGLGTKH